jgi:hypothetical protein
MANGGEEVKLDDGQLFLGAGAEPLSQSRLQTGHLIDDRPSGNSDDHSEMTEKEVIDTEAGSLMRIRKDDSRGITAIKG